MTTAQDNSVKTYKVVRHFERGRAKLLRVGLSLEEAQRHCTDPETSSRTATSKKAMALTAKRGPWFDGYFEEES